MISRGVRILPRDERFVKLIESHVVECAVDDITEMSWNQSIWNHLAIEAKRKTLTWALAASYLQQTPEGKQTAVMRNLTIWQGTNSMVAR